ncbi:MAG: hypothetical protein QOF49_345, partial [Chloroflexota bacterium]|nr:hypothetical protein [Chloroflexota bacterium]
MQAARHNDAAPASEALGDRLSASIATTQFGTTQFGTAYFGVRDPDHAARDLEAIKAAGHDWVLFPMTQDDAVWEGSTFRLLVEAAGSVDLEPIVSPWGGRDFGGEGIPGPLTVREWLARV